MKAKTCGFLHERDFNVRVSILGRLETEEAYVELIRDSLGAGIVGSVKTIIGNYVAIKNDGKVITQSFQVKGNQLIDSLPDEVKKSSIVRFNIRRKEGGYKSWIISRHPDICSHLNRGDFNVRVSLLEKGHLSITEKTLKYYELVRDSLGEDIINNSNILIGNYMLQRGDGTIGMKPFQLKGIALMPNINSALRKSTSMRINIRLKQGGFKSWIIFN